MSAHGRPRQRGSRGKDADESVVGMYKVAYEEAKRVCLEQLAELDSMRQRSVQFLAFAGSATAFLVGTGLSNQPGDERSLAFFVHAGIASAASVASIIYVASILLSLVPPVGARGSLLRPWRLRRAMWNFQLDARVFVEEWIDPEVGRSSEADFYRDLALHYGEKDGENESQLDTIRAWYLRFVIAGSTQIVLWAALVWIYA